MTPRATVLVVDDEDYVRDSLVEVLAGEPGLIALAAGTTEEARALLGRESVDVVLADLHMPDGGAQALLDDRRDDEDAATAPPLIVITGVGTIPRAVEAMRGGAFDFVQKPLEVDALVLLVRRALEHRRLLGQVAVLRGALQRGRDPMLGRSAATERVRALVQQVARTEATVLVTGESGTGKELVAEAVHAGSPRSGGLLVKINCAAVPETLFESEFFGHRRGSFSGAVADRAGRFAEAAGGTLVLDEISALRPEMQAKLLRVLESGEYQVVGETGTRTADVRVVALSNEDLQERIRQGAFRSDLYYRLAVFPIALEPLRRRVEDVEPLARAFLANARRASPDDVALGSDLVGLLESYAWPGNVRELRNVIERATILAAPDWPDAALLAGLLEPALTRGAGGDLNLRSRLAEHERELLRAALERSGGRRAQAAELLGVDPRNLAYYLRKHGLQGDTRG